MHGQSPFRVARQRFYLVALLTFFGGSIALADLKPDIMDCDAKKAARNAAMDATVGVSGRCDTEKVVDKTKDDAKDAVDLDKKKKNRDKGEGRLKHDKD